MRDGPAPGLGLDSGRRPGEPVHSLPSRTPGRTASARRIARSLKKSGCGVCGGLLPAILLRQGERQIVLGGGQGRRRFHLPAPARLGSCKVSLPVAGCPGAGLAIRRRGGFGGRHPGEHRAERQRQGEGKGKQVAGRNRRRLAKGGGGTAATAASARAIQSSGRRFSCPYSARSASDQSEDQAAAEGPPAPPAFAICSGDGAAWGMPQRMAASCCHLRRSAPLPGPATPGGLPPLACDLSRARVPASRMRASRRFLFGSVSQARPCARKSQRDSKPANGAATSAASEAEPRGRTAASPASARGSRGNPDGRAATVAGIPGAAAEPAGVAPGTPAGAGCAPVTSTESAGDSSVL